MLRNNHHLLAFNNHYAKAEACFSRKNFDQARAEYTFAISICSSDAEAYYKRGMTHEHLYQADKAMSDYASAVEKSPKNDTYINRLVKFLRVEGDLTVIRREDIFNAILTLPVTKQIALLKECQNKDTRLGNYICLETDTGVSGITIRLLQKIEQRLKMIDPSFTSSKNEIKLADASIFSKPKLTDKPITVGEPITSKQPKKIDELQKTGSCLLMHQRI